MFILRKIEKETKRQSNFCLGCSYTYAHAADNEPLFKNLFHRTDVPEVLMPDVYGIVVDSYENYIPLYNNYENYIMTESGKTFSRV